MSVKSFTITLSTTLIGTILPAAAAVEERNTPSNLAVWIFLGFCALIIIAQLCTLFVGSASRKSSESTPGQEKASEHSEAH
jgi:heme/copper-type cytochrome/quinol oxidase subunit 4